MSRTERRALSVLRTFERRRELGITEIANRTGLNVSTAHRIVRALALPIGIGPM